MFELISYAVHYELFMFHESLLRKVLENIRIGNDNLVFN